MEASEDNVVLDLHEYYEKQTYRNRFEILGVNGKMSLTIPVQGQKGEKILTKDIRIAEHSWRKQHIKSIRSAYGRAAFFEFYFDEIETVFLKKQEFMVDFSLEIIRWLRTKGIPISHQLSNEFIDYSQKEIVLPNLDIDAPSYPQVFSDRFEFVPHLSALDLLMNLGPRSADYILLWKNGK